MTIDERARRIVQGIVLVATTCDVNDSLISELARAVAGEMGSEADEWADKYADMTRQRDAARRIALEQALEIAKNHAAGQHADKANLIDRVADDICKNMADLAK